MESCVDVGNGENAIKYVYVGGAEMEMNISITDTAKDQVTSLLNKAPEDTIGLRLTIKTTGCSGNSYKMEYAENGIENDDKIESNGVEIYIPKIYSWMLIGTVIDYITDELGNSRFEFTNPNEESRCGCGESFQINIDRKTI